MNILIHPDSAALGDTAGKEAARIIKDAIAKSGRAHIILATGTSQFETLRQLMSDKDIAWDKVIMFHLDEYIGISDQHPASFRKYLRERFLEKVPPLRAAHLINGEGDAVAECERLGMMIAAHPIDVALVGIGENGHL